MTSGTAPPDRAAIPAGRPSSTCCCGAIPRPFSSPSTDSDARVVGTLIVGWDGWRCHLYRLAVDRTVRRSGIAGTLVAEARRRAA